MVLNVELPNYSTVIIIGSIFAIISDILISISGKKQDSETKSANLLIWAGIVNIIFEVLLYLVPNLSISAYTEIELQIYMGYKIFRGFLFSVPYLFTFGLTFLIFGRRNREKFGSFVLMAGILLTISNLVKILYLNAELVSIFLVIFGINFSIIIFQLFFLIIVFFPSWIAFTFLIVHGFNNDDKYLMWAGIMALVGSIGVPIVTISIAFIYSILVLAPF